MSKSNKSYEERHATQLERVEREKARLKAMEQRKKEQDRKARTRRLCDIGGAVEHHANCKITNMNAFNEFLEKYGPLITQSQQQSSPVVTKIATSATPVNAIQTPPVTASQPSPTVTKKVSRQAPVKAISTSPVAASQPSPTSNKVTAPPTNINASTAQVVTPVPSVPNSTLAGGIQYEAPSVNR